MSKRSQGLHPGIIKYRLISFSCKPDLYILFIVNERKIDISKPQYFQLQRSNSSKTDQCNIYPSSFFGSHRKAGDSPRWTQHCEHFPYLGSSDVHSLKSDPARQIHLLLVDQLGYRRSKFSRLPVKTKKHFYLCIYFKHSSGPSTSRLTNRNQLLEDIMKTCPKMQFNLKRFVLVLLATGHEGSFLW